MWSKCPRAQPFWYLGATLLPSSLHMLAGIPFELGLGAVCFAMTLVLTIPIYGIHLAIRSGGRSVRALVRSKARLGFVSTRMAPSVRLSARRCPGRHLGAASLGKSASWAALAGLIGLAFDIGYMDT